jgi:hypothetical protein
MKKQKITQIKIHKWLREDSSISEKHNKTKADTFKQYLPYPFNIYDIMIS